MTEENAPTPATTPPQAMDETPTVNRMIFEIEAYALSDAAREVGALSTLQFALRLALRVGREQGIFPATVQSLARPPLPGPTSWYSDQMKDDIQAVQDGTLEDWRYRGIALRFLAAAERECGFLISCPWCGKPMRRDPIAVQIRHLIRCGDRRIAFEASDPHGVYPFVEVCDRCDDGVLTSIAEGSASREETSYCSCPRGRQVKNDSDDALEAKGEERAR